MNKFEIYTDGSFNAATGSCTGAFVILKNNELLHAARINITDPELTVSWNVSGELVTVAVALNVLSGLVDDSTTIVSIYYDYVGVQNFVTGPTKWKPKKYVPCLYEAAYKNVKESKPNLQIQFIKVKAHSGIYWNEVVDTLAKGRVPQICVGKMLPLITM